MSDHNMSVSESANQFAFELFRVFIDRHRKEYKNLCFSPFAVFTSLTMMLIGAKNATHSQLSKVLHLHNFNDSTKYEELMKLRESIIKGNHEIILSDSYLYVDKSVTLKEEFKNLLREYFDVKPKIVSFEDIDQTLQTINGDSMRSTDNAIDDVIAKRDITENKNIKLMLTNALFFRGYWATSFSDPKKESFGYCCGMSKRTTMQIQMISHVGTHRYYEDQQLKAQIVSLAYETSDLRMMVILPKSKSSDGKYLIQQLNRIKFMSIIESLTYKGIVEVTLPRFALDAQQVSLQRTIMQMGAIDMFDENKSDLGGVAVNQNIHLTKLVNKAFMVVDERGSSVTSLRIELKKNKIKGQNSTLKPIVFKADHPFAFIVYDKTTKVALFMGFFGDPKEMLEIVRESELTKQQIEELLKSN